MTARQSRIHVSRSLSSLEEIELTGAASHYLTRVLRLREGDPVILFDGGGRDFSGEISEIRRQGVRVRLSGSERVANESALDITLVQAISRGERMDHSLQKATELGVTGIQPVMSSRVGVRLTGDRLVKRMAHWQGVVVSACEQSGRAVVPEVRKPIPLADWLSAAGDSLRLVLDPTAGQKLSSVSPNGSAVSILVGPEGGLSTAEMEDVRASGVRPVSLGPRVLRTETAGPAAISVLQVIAGDF